MAINDINNKTDGIYDDILPNTEMRQIFRYPQALFALAVNYAVELAKIDGGRGVMGLVGPYAARGTQGKLFFYYFINKFKTYFI